MDRIRISTKITAAACARFAGPVRAGVLRRSRRPGWAGLVAVLAAVVAAFGVPGAGQSAALASSLAVLNWTQQAPATSPPARVGAPMAYDAATGNVVLFGGLGNRSVLGGTWTWDGSTWTKQAPKTSPLARVSASMAYDAATGNVVLFGGEGRSGHILGGTWTWDGSTWTKQAPKTSPPVRGEASMAYDAATGTVVLFGGDVGVQHFLGDTWTWDGSTWTKQAPKTSPSPRAGASMAYDAATGNIVLFGGFNRPSIGGELGATWTWDGSTWTKQAPDTSPSAPGGRVHGLRRGHRQRGPVRRRYLVYHFRRHLDLGRLYLDDAGPQDQPACPAQRVDGLRRGHRQRGPVRRPGRRFSRGHLDLGLWLAREAV